MSRQTTRWLLVPAALALAATAGLTLRAQAPRDPGSPSDPRPGASASVQDALLRPFPFRFARPTPLNEAARQLGRALNAPVAIDRAALDRLGLKIDDEVQLELEGVRLKTGLKLLLDQLDLTYRVVPEDNLLIITDLTGSADPVDEVLSQIKALHRDLHDTQDAIDDIRAALGLGEEGGVRVRKPTIIEEMPPATGEKDKDKYKAKPQEPPPASTPPRSRRGA
jgi:hypothetical protein